jgi:hypothetical protein
MDLDVAVLRLFANLQNFANLARYLKSHVFLP